jgi:hypothetical protein
LGDYRIDFQSDRSRRERNQLLPDLHDFLAETIDTLQNGVEQRVYHLEASEDSTNPIQQFISALTEYFVGCWLSTGYGARDEVWEKWDTPSHAERTEMLNALQYAFCEKGEIADHPDWQRGLTKAKGNFAETLLRWIEETFRNGEKRFIPAVPLPTSQGLIDLVEIIFPEGSDWFAILWESKATETHISGVASDAYEQLDDYPDRLFYELQDRNALLKEVGATDTPYAQALRTMRKLIQQNSPKIHYGLFITHDAATSQPHLRDLPKHPSGIPRGCHHLTFVALPNFADFRGAVWRQMELKS